ncbi:MAG: tetratricopeptide repeat protein, partial [bacterium]|nr:tetratricopeptide repeat protein [bacterium]
LNGFKAVLSKGISEHAATYGSMGICYGYLGQKEDAMACFDKALEIDPAYEPAMFNLKALESLKDGETFYDLKPESIKDDKEQVMEKKSFMQALFQKLMGR